VNDPDTDVTANPLTQTVSIKSVNKLQLQRSWVKLVRPLSTVDNTRDYARVSHSRQWSNYNISHYNGHELSWLDHCLLWITLATTLVYPTVDCGLTITYMQLNAGKHNRHPIRVETACSRQCHGRQVSCGRRYL